MRAVQVFGFHLATVDLRQSSDKHEAVVAELLAWRASRPTTAALDESGATPRCCCGVLADARPLRVVESARADAYSEASLKELAIFEAARRDAAPLRPRGAAPLHHLAHRERQRPARGAACC